MKRLQIYLLITMVMLFFILIGLDLYAWPLSKFTENVMQSLFAVILFLIDPKTLLKMMEEPHEKDVSVDSNTTGL